MYIWGFLFIKKWGRRGITFFNYDNTDMAQHDLIRRVLTYFFPNFALHTFSPNSFIRAETARLDEGNTT